jgi:hypothetical protein
VGIDSETTLKILNNVLLEEFSDTKEISMIELGNQFIDGDSNKSSKKYFSNKIKSHISIDINGLSGALKYNLCEDLDIGRKADIVTNFGTSEHVKNQFFCFKNMHNFCKIGGLFFHFVPLVDNWIKHCEYWYDTNFFQKMALINNYSIIENIIFNQGKYSVKKNMVLCIMRKNSHEFVTDETFFKDLIHTKE